MHRKNRLPSEIELNWESIYRIISSNSEPIESLVEPALEKELLFVKNLTKATLPYEIKGTFGSSKEDQLLDEGLNVIRDAFTPKGWPSRFSNGSFGIYYGAKALETAIREKAYHHQKFLSRENLSPKSVEVSVYQSENISKPLLDIRSEQFKHLHHLSNYEDSQNFCLKAKHMGAWGIVYNSARHFGGECVAILRPQAVMIPIKQTDRYALICDGAKIICATKNGEIIVTI